MSIDVRVASHLDLVRTYTSSSHLIMSSKIHSAFSQPPIYHEVTVVGGGVSGICLGAQLKRKFGVTDIKVRQGDMPFLLD